MKRFELIDGSCRTRKASALLLWQQDVRELVIEICDWAGPLDLPMTLGALAQKGLRRIEGEWVERWVRERVPPPGRQNLGEVLKANNLEFYDEYELFFTAEGRCAQDDFFIRAIEPASRSASADDAFADLSKVVASRFRQAREEAGLTQSELAKRAGLRQAALSRFESGRSNPTLALLESVAVALDVELDIALR